MGLHTFSDTTQYYKGSNYFDTNKENFDTKMNLR